ncbi:MAG TPA: glycosyltransferase family 2 protein [Gemmatimonadota bacterium]|nr:glycosyltransferase family 2 protein [Gemmatimonadota bacterium]
MRDSVSLFVPAYDEAETLVDNMPRLLQAAEEVAANVQLVIVDNGSTDTTIAVARDLASTDPRIVPLRIPERGVGLALKAALPHLRHDAVVAVDADLAMDLSFVGEALARLDRGADVVVGAKRTDSQDRPWLRVLVSDLFVFVMRRGVGVPFHDVSIGAKAYRKELLHRYERLIGRGSNYVIDILVQAWRDGLRIEELSVACEDNRKSHFNLFHEGVYRFGHLFGLVLRRRLGLLRATPAPSPRTRREALPISR